MYEISFFREETNVMFAQKKKLVLKMNFTPKSMFAQNLCIHFFVKFIA